MTITSSGSRRMAPAVARNRSAIGEILETFLRPGMEVLEVASGTGEHAAYLCQRCAGVWWQPSDADPEALASIDAWRAQADDGRVRAPMVLDVRAGPWPAARYDALVCINMVHISPWESTVGLFDGAARVLTPGGVLFLYGPYRERERPLADSNAAFDRWLKSQDSRWGLRRREALEDLARERGLALAHRFEMPANNLSLVFRAREGAGDHE